jgi:serine/threonine protein kinase
MMERQSEQEARARLRIGTVIKGKYRLDELLGIGGMAAVYRATHRNQAELAIKMLHPELSTYEDFRSRFLREGYAANSVKHPNAVLIMDDDVTDDGAAFLVMELLRGMSVDAVRKIGGGRMPAFEASGVGIQVLDVFRAAHEKGIIHRDIKPANLFVTHDGTVKVLDFGIARARDEAAGAEVTGSGVLLGTPAYMAPEQALALTADIDARTDIYSIGATLYTLMSGKAVHVADNPTRALVSAASEKAKSLKEVAPLVHDAVVAVVDRALAFERDDRWPDARSMQRALVDACKTAYSRTPSKGALARFVSPPDADLASTRPDEPHGPQREAPVIIVTKPPPPPAPAAPTPSLAAALVAAALREEPVAPSETSEPPSGEQAEPLRPTQPAVAPLPVATTTTAEPVSSSASPAQLAAPEGRPSRRWVGVAIAAGVLALGGIAASRGLRSHTSATNTTVAAPPSEANPSTATPTATANPTATPTATATPTLDGAETTSSSPNPTASASSSRRAPSAPKRPDCSPNFVYDKDGNKHFKPECF